LERTRHSTALPFAYLAVFKTAEKILDLIACSLGIESALS